MAEEEMLVPSEIYLKAGIHIGTKYKTGYMKKFIYKTRGDGLSVMSIPDVDERIKGAINLLSQYEPEDIILVSQRENGWDAIKLFAKMIGARYFPGRYPPGILTNVALKNYQQAKLMFVVDPWSDRNAVEDAQKVGIPIVALVDTNNTFNKLDYIIPANNKGKKSLNFIMFLIAKEYAKRKGIISNDKELDINIDQILDDELDI